jgi:UDP-N-acetyl-D-mannosaminuronic acid dehydrogenase
MTMERIDDIKVTIFGLGHIGLPTACLFAHAGIKVIGVARNQKKINMINRCKSPIFELGLDDLLYKAVKNGNFKATSNGLEAVKKSDVMIIIVPTPMDQFNRADLTAVKSASKIISKALKEDDLVIIESTVPQGTCENIVIPILEKSGLKASKDFGVIYTPERAIPNNTLYEMTHNARIIGGIDHKSIEMADSLYQKITIGKIIKVKNLITAETVKLIENTYRDTNIALANEIAMICESLGVDAIEAIQAANYHPRVNIHTPGPGVGGHCLAIDPYFIVETAEENGLDAPLIKNARIINEGMPNHVIKLIEDALNENGKEIKDSEIGILGVAYKGNVADARETPAEPLIRILIENGAKVYAHDPYTHIDYIKSFGAIPVDMENALKCDVVALLADHDQYRNITPEMVGRGIFICTRPILNPEPFIKNGINFRGVGRVNIY